MAFVPVPKDLTRVKTKVAFNLTKRQLICFGAAALIGIPAYFLLKGAMGVQGAAIVMVILMLPCFLFGVYEKNGQPLEVVIKNMAAVMFQRPKQRPYQTDNFYSVLERQAKLDKEVMKIVHKNKARKPKAG